jgi:DNA-directed RNA polymerase specialized sigma24 family protein
MSNLRERKPLDSQVFEMEALLERYFEQFLQWARILTRGDAGMAEEIVQDLCLQLTLASPDLSQVANLDGYLYTCLRNLYSSNLSRASRDRLRLVSIEDFDSLEAALTSSVVGDVLERQNILLRICAYAVWRKETSKSASYLILHFFHGYTRSEVANVARLPLAAIYNKLKDARTEVRAHLESTGKMRVLARNAPPEPHTLISSITSEELFQKIRSMIFSSKVCACLPAETLLSHYQDGRSTPIPCPLLSHIVSCERCLRILDKHSGRPYLDERGPMDRDDISHKRNASKDHAVAFGSMMSAVGRRRSRISEHRPRLLAIAIDGKIVAFHDIQGPHSSLSSRIEDYSSVQFIEVFSEQELRLAHIPLYELPPQGAHVQTQLVSLSDSRWLSLTIRFDGLGLHAEASYFDPALASETATASTTEQTMDAPQQQVFDESLSGVVKDRMARLREYVARAMQPPVLAGVAVVACLAITASYILHRHQTGAPTAERILERSETMEALNPATETEHQILQIELTSEHSTVTHGTIELWRDGNGQRYVRHLYDSEKRLLATEWQSAKAERFTTTTEAEKNLSSDDRRLIESGLWKRDVSSRSFESAARTGARVSAMNAGFEVTTINTDRADDVLSQTLIVDRGYHLVEERLRIRNGAGVENVRFVQSLYSKERRESVPDSIFEPSDVRSLPSETTPTLRRGAQGGALLLNNSPAKLAQLQLSVLFELNKIGADTEDPIAVEETSDGRIHVTGVIADEQRLAQIRQLLDAVPNHDLLVNSLVSATHAAKSSALIGANVRPTRIDGSVLDAPAATEALRQHFQRQGLSGAALDTAMLHFSDEALRHAQHALQGSYALERLGSILVEAGPNSLDLSTQRKWAAMVSQHAVAVHADLQALRSQLETISDSKQVDRTEEFDGSIKDPKAFHATARKLRTNLQSVYAQVGMLFTGTASSTLPKDPEQLLANTICLLPLDDAIRMEAFATRLPATEHLTQSGKVRQAIKVP